MQQRLLKLKEIYIDNGGWLLILRISSKQIKIQSGYTFGKTATLLHKELHMNTTNTIYTSYLDSVYADQVTTVNLENIINRIRSNEFQSIAEKIRLETDNHKQKQLKQKIPAFFPCLVLNNEKNAYNEQTELNGII